MVTDIMNPVIATGLQYIFLWLQKMPLHYAASYGCLGVVKHLVEQGASAVSKKEYVNSKDRKREVRTATAQLLIM